MAAESNSTDAVRSCAITVGRIGGELYSRCLRRQVHRVTSVGRFPAWQGSDAHSRPRRRLQAVEREGSSLVRVLQGRGRRGGQR
jgi:hypothetical protein